MDESREDERKIWGFKYADVGDNQKCRNYTIEMSDGNRSNDKPNV